MDDWRLTFNANVGINNAKKSLRQMSELPRLNIRRILLSFLIGCFLTGAIYLYGIHPRNGPTTGIAILIIPFQVVASLVTQNEPVADIIYYTIQVLFWSLLCFCVLCILGKFKKSKTGR